MKFTDIYPDRVTRGEDGVWRWSCNVNMKQDHYLRNLIKKIMLIICGSICALMLFFMLSVGDFSFFWIPLACCGFDLLLTKLVYRLYRASLHDRLIMGFEMNDEAILMVRTPSEQNHLKTMGLITASLGAASGHPSQGAGQGAAISAAAQPVMIRFKNIRSIHEFPDTCMLNLQTLMTLIQVWVPTEDYGMIVSFIREHIPASARQNEKLRWPKRLLVSSLLSLGINAVIAVINVIGFNRTGRLPVSLTRISGDIVHQYAIAMSTMFLREGVDREAPWWMHRLETQAESAVLGFLSIALIVFLILTVIDIYRKGAENPDRAN